MWQGIKDEMAVMKRELSAEREVADEKHAKKFKLEKAPIFRKKGHQKQYQHNEEVWLKVTDARLTLDERPTAVEKAKALLKEGEKLINERQKHIRVADRSDNGWATVEEYVEDKLADNSDDEIEVFITGRCLCRKKNWSLLREVAEVLGGFILRVLIFRAQEIRRR